MKPAAAEDFFARLARANPAPKGELHYTDPYTLLVAVVLSAQSTDKGVNKATARLFTLASTPQAMLDLGEAALREQVKTIGLYNTKAKNIIKLSRILVDQYGGKVPPHRAALEEFPGVGRKTANVVLNIAFGQPTIAVDTHIFRLCNRSGLARGRTPLEVEKGLERVVPASYRLHAHHWLILHGRYICTARKPRCADCALIDLCAFKSKTGQKQDRGGGEESPRVKRVRQSASGGRRRRA